MTPQRQSFTYANEADVLNVALFGITAKEWRQTHSDSKGNIRDEASLQQLIVRNRQTTPRMDRHETIVTGRCETFRCCHIGGMGMTSAELKHHAKQQEWAAQIQNCRSSGLPVRAWCRQEGINASTYYRWERELLTAADQAPCSAVPAVTFAELPEPKKMSRNVSERCATLRIGSASLDIYPGCDAEQLRLLVELLSLC